MRNSYDPRIQFDPIVLQSAETPVRPKISFVEYSKGISQIRLSDVEIWKKGTKDNFGKGNRKEWKTTREKRWKKERKVECKRAKKNTGVTNRTRFVSV